MRLHGLYELFRRAGMKSADWARCQILMNAHCIEVRLGWESGKRIEFPVFPANVQSARTARLKWMFPPGDRMRELITDFVLPHHLEPVPEGPLFEQVEEGRVRCKTDLPLIALAVLCRWADSVISVQ
jgi:hypothetical protein